MARCTRIIGHMVTKNEMGRYLDATIAWLREITDLQYVYDDRSTDHTLAFLQRSEIPFGQRRVNSPGFAEDESAFRATAWRAMEDRCDPTSADWILCVDADEFIVANRPEDTRDTLTEAVEQNMAIGAVTLTVNEVFAFDEDHTPLMRVDGFWGQILACRLVRWRPGGEFAKRIEGGGSVPADWATGAGTVNDLAVMHLGYARPTDRAAKHARYRASSGHNPSHVASILEPPSLVRWDGLCLTWPESRTRP